jgi:hypothetical protein
MKKTYPYICKFCKKPGTVRLDDNPLIPGSMFSIDLWLQQVCCNRCDEYHITQRDVSEKINKACTVLMVARNQGAKNLAELEVLNKEKIKGLLEKLIALVCKHYSCEAVYDAVLAEALFRRPDLSGGLLRRYVNGVQAGRGEVVKVG